MKMFLRGAEWVTVPHAPENAYELKPLNGKKLAKAQTARIFSAMDTIDSLGGAEKFSAFQSAVRNAQGAPAAEAPAPDPSVPEVSAADIAAAQADPLNAYDQYKLLEYGVKDWRGPDTNDPETGEKIPVSVEAIEDLDPITLEWAAREILRLSGIDADPTAAQKNA